MFGLVVSILSYDASNQVPYSVVAHYPGGCKTMHHTTAVMKKVINCLHVNAQVHAACNLIVVVLV
jgi:peptidase E